MNSLLHTIQHSALWKAINCIMLVLCADILFLDQPAGFTLGLFSLILLGAVVLHNRESMTHGLGQWLIALTILQALAMIYHPKTLNIIMVTLCLISLSAMKHKQWQMHGGKWIRLLWRFVCAIIARPLRHGRVLWKASERYTPQGWGKRSVKGWFLPLLCSLTFIILFAQANPVIEQWVDAVDMRFLSRTLDGERFWFWLTCLCACWTLIRPRIWLTKRVTRRRSHTRHAVLWLFSGNAITRSLILFNLIFVMQTSLDILYLWGGAALPNHMSYAEYAHRGAYPLMVTALLAAIFVLIALRPDSPHESQYSVRVLVYLWIAQNIFLVISSIWRMTLYIEAYSLTYLRVYALLWMGLVAIGLGLIIARILWQRSNVWLINSNLMLTLAMLYSLSFINLGGMIAQYNVEHCKEVSGTGVMLDTYYISNIGAEALPALRYYRQHANTNTQDMIWVHKRINKSLYKQLRNWRGWSVKHNALMHYIPITTKHSASGWLKPF